MTAGAGRPVAGGLSVNGDNKRRRPSLVSTPAAPLSSWPARRGIRIVSQLSPKILGPLPDDQRELSGFSIPLRVCDSAAQAISHAKREIEFDRERFQKGKDAAVAKLKEYCENRR